ncbi:DNA replication/repair protein RecF [Pseudoalteromonas xiamenensis]|uniref:DNA replication/repair protein RecF n=1 Tax=Pseudoalteromonas xiamenensis TaxID=882626 RepID=UPI0027E3F2BA|nr:DNA replication/repair protein RecF [Pseudoalteromonas xiamenensis]WMN58635.1 DNA replication/repair protein RecF [Pseudoalteromonas xiamenensis]
MSLNQLSLSQFRNIEAISLEPSEHINVILGANGSGKSSLLEAIYFLSHGKSFRTTNSKLLIRHEQPQCIVHGKKSLHHLLVPVGISKNQQGESIIKIQGKVARRMSELAQLLPVQVITPESYSLFFGGPKERRRFLDLGVFHVEHEFMSAWQQFSQVLKQRNALLKTRPQKYSEQIKYWDKEFVRLAEVVNRCREAYISRFNDVFFGKIIANLPFGEGLEIRFQSGWKKGEALQNELESHFERDVKLGYTSKGPHKSDFNFFTKGMSVEQVLSRGQLKLLLYALKITQTDLIESQSKKQSILLIDDLPSELSSETIELVARLLQLCQSQLFITAIDEQSIARVVEPMERELKMFHVKHGNLITR